MLASIVSVLVVLIANSHQREEIFEFSPLYSDLNILEEKKEGVGMILDRRSLIRRLSHDFTVSLYHLTMMLDERKSDFSAVLRLQISCTSPSQNLLLNQHDLSIHEVFFSNDTRLVAIDDSERESVSKRTIDKLLHSKPLEEANTIKLGDSVSTPQGLLSVFLPRMITAGESFSLILSYSGVYSHQLEGMYKSVYQTENGEKRTIISTHLEPIGARRVLPCLDEPEFKSVFVVSIIHRRTHRALSNMDVEIGYPRNIKAEDGLVITKFVASLKMSTYLLAIAVTDYEYLEKISESGCRIRLYAQASEVQHGKWAVEVTDQVLSFFEQFFGHKYPNTKIDLLAIPDFQSGAMEDWGLISFRESNLLYDSSRVPSDSKKQIAMVIAHEIAHQWFGNLVTMRWWDDIWLNEGFANFAELLGTHIVNPKYQMLDQQLITEWSLAIELDSLNNTHKLSQSLHDESAIEELFDSISYNKGACILRMLESFLGYDLFMSGIKRYISLFMYSNADSNDLWNTINMGSGDLNIKAIMDTWTYQRGFPLIQVELGEKDLTIFQTPYMKASFAGKTKKDEIDPFNNLWNVPIHYITDQNYKAPTLIWMRQETQIAFPNNGISWIKVNAGARGFYMVNYNRRGWNAIIEQLRKNHEVFREIDRANLIHDVYKLACDGIIPATITLDLTTYMEKETSYLPWAMLRQKSVCLYEILREKSAIKAFKNFIWGYQKKLLDFTVLQNPDSFTPIEVSQQYEAHSYGLKNHFLPNLIVELRKIHNELMLRNLAGIKKSPEIRTLTLSFATNRSDSQQFATLWLMYKESTSTYDRRILLKILATYQHDEATKLNLNHAIDTDVVKHQDGLSFLMNILKSTRRFPVVWSFIENCWSILQLRYQDSTQLGDLIMIAVDHVDSKKSLMRVEDFLRRNSLGNESFMEKQIFEKINRIRNSSGSDRLLKSRCKVMKWMIDKNLMDKSKLPKECLLGHD